MLYLKSSKDDVLGDSWAGTLRKVWQRMQKIDQAETAARNRGRGRHRFLPVLGTGGAYSWWQWLQCKMAGMESRIVASPQAMAIAGLPIPDEYAQGEISRLSDLAFKSIVDEDKIEQERWAWGGVSFLDIPLHAPSFREHREILQRESVKQWRKLSLAGGTWDAFLGEYRFQCSGHVHLLSNQPTD